MATLISKSESSTLDLPDRSGDPKEYMLWINYRWEKLRWDEMTRHQRRQEIDAEKRAIYDALFNPCGIA